MQTTLARGTAAGHEHALKENTPSPKTIHQCASSTYIAWIRRPSPSRTRGSALSETGIKRVTTAPTTDWCRKTSAHPTARQAESQHVKQPHLPPPTPPGTHKRRAALRNGPPWHGHHVIVPVGWRPMDIDVCVDSRHRHTAAPVQAGTHGRRRGPRRARAGRVVPPGRLWRRRRPTISRHGSAPGSSAPASRTRRAAPPWSVRRARHSSAGSGQIMR